MSQTFLKSFAHLKDRPKADQALPLLQRIASLVKPIMRKRGWVLPVLAEFFPESPNLLGLNINGGQKILVRLRPAHAPDTFYDDESIVHTMLHELTHNVHGPHDEKFYKFLAGLEEEYEVLKRSGYAGEGFFSKGHRLGTNVSHNLPPHLARQKALEAAEKRRQINIMLSGSGRLGGPGGRIRPNKSPRELAAEAAERRARDEKACASGALAQREAEKAAKESIEDKMIDLTTDSDSEPEVVLVDQPPSAASPSKAAAPTNAGGAKQHHTTRSSSDRPGGSRSPIIRQSAPATSSDTAKVVPSSTLESWTCSRCTLNNDPLTLQCAACDLIRPYTGEAEAVDGWTCTICGERGIPADFWSCSFCGHIKTQS